MEKSIRDRLFDCYPQGVEALEVAVTQLECCGASQKDILQFAASLLYRKLSREEIIKLFDDYPSQPPSEVSAWEESKEEKERKAKTREALAAFQRCFPGGKGGIASLSTCVKCFTSKVYLDSAGLCCQCHQKIFGQNPR